MSEQRQDQPSTGGGLDDVEVWLPPEIDTTVPHPARRYDYWLGVILSPGDDHGVDLRGHVVDIVLDGA